ncbi:MAG: hypothetical protein LBU76_02235 [Azoarcus sp.]|jgi:hypothetical protein|nr:hypothetical protein [Azoarcus sp.]
MMTEHDLENGVKTHYSPLEAAVRLSGLIRHEADIQTAMGNNPWPGADECARWPALHLYLGRIRDALLHSELVCCKSGIAGKDSPLPLDDPGLSIRHVALRKWIENSYPEECPVFLFGKGYVPHAVSERACRVLSAELQAKSIELTQCSASLDAIRKERDLLVRQHQSLASKYSNETSQDGAPYRRRISTLLGIIEALENFLIRGRISDQLDLPFRTQDSLIKALLRYFPKRPGMSERSLREKFADARKFAKGIS